MATVNYLRAGVRIPVELPVEIRWKSSTGRFREVEGKTASMSGNGMLLTVPIRLRHATPITITAFLPVEITKVRVKLFCEGRVVRQEQAGKRPGIGAIIDHYQLRPTLRPV